MPATYIVVMALYTMLAAYIVYLVSVNTLRSRNLWEQIMAIFVIVPFLMRLFFVK